MELSEAIQKCRVDNVFLCQGPRQPQNGSLALIGHHLIFSPSTATATTRRERQSQELWLLHRAVDRALVEPISRDPNVKAGAYLRLKFKNFMICCFEIADADDCMALKRSIEDISDHGFENDYPFYYQCPFMVLDDGWRAFAIKEVFSKLDDYFTKVLQRRNDFRISYVNTNFKVCSSYPEKVIVPRWVDDEDLKASAKFREGGRFPVLCYYHGEKKSYIIRCAEPLVGSTNRRCAGDEYVMNSMLSRIYGGVIFDTRWKTSATRAATYGGGCEPEKNYSGWKYVYGSVPRINELRNSLAKLVEACSESSVDKWLPRLASSGWLKYIAKTLTGATNVAQYVHGEGTEEVPVVVHGAEGTDSTLLITSVAQVLLDRDARTVRGFQSLIEHEWVAAGHPFSLRCAHSAYATGSVTGWHESPVFLCFLDCVWQVMRQYPTRFEFTEQLLMFLFEHAYASEFGTFLGASEREKREARVKERTVSLWSHVNRREILPSYLNALYEPYTSVLWPSVAPQSIALWERMYLRWQRDWTEVDAVAAELTQLKLKEKELQAKILSVQSLLNPSRPTETDRELRHGYEKRLRFGDHASPTSG